MKRKFFQIFKEPEAFSTPKEQNEFFELWEKLDDIEAEDKSKYQLIKFGSPGFAKIVSVAALILLSVALGVLAGKWMYEKKPEKELITGLNSDHSVTRIRSVQSIEEKELDKQEVVAALLHVLSTDVNENVRLAALGVLNPLIKDDMVRAEVIRSIANQPSTLVQVNILRSIILHNNDGNLKELKFLLEAEQVSSMTKDRIQNLVKS